MKSSRSELRRRYSCEEVYDRMEKGLCLFCEELDTPSHNLKHRRSHIFMIEVEDDQAYEENELITPVVETDPSLHQVVKPVECVQPSLDSVVLNRKGDHPKSVAEENLILPLGQNIEHLVGDENQNTLTNPKNFMMDTRFQPSPSRPPEPPDRNTSDLTTSIQDALLFEAGIVKLGFKTDEEPVASENQLLVAFDSPNEINLSFPEVESRGVKEMASVKVIQDEESSPENEPALAMLQPIETFLNHQVPIFALAQTGNNISQLHTGIGHDIDNLLAPKEPAHVKEMEALLYPHKLTVCDEEKKKLRSVAADAKKGRNGFEGYVKVNSIDEEKFVGFIESNESQLAREILVTNSGIFTNTRLIQAEFYKKHKWRSKRLQTISVFRTTHSSKFTDLVLKGTLTGRTRTDSSQAIIDDVWKLFFCPGDHKTNFVAESDIYKSGQHSSRTQKRWIKKFLWSQRLQERNCFMLEVSSVEFVRCKAHGKELFDTSQTMQRRKLRGLESVAVLDGILVNKSLTGLSVLVDSAFSSCRLLSKHHMESVEEMVSDEKMNDERLHLDQVNAFRTPQICVSKSNSPVIRNLNEDVRACKEYKSMMAIVQRSVQTNSTKEDSSNLSGDHFTDGEVWLHAMLRESMFLLILPLNQEKDWFKIRTWFHNVFDTFCVYRVYHLQRPPELRRAKRYDQEFDKVFSLSSLRTRMF